MSYADFSNFTHNNITTVSNSSLVYADGTALPDVEYRDTVMDYEFFEGERYIWKVCYVTRKSEILIFITDKLHKTCKSLRLTEVRTVGDYGTSTSYTNYYGAGSLDHKLSYATDEGLSMVLYEYGVSPIPQTHYFVRPDGVIHTKDGYLYGMYKEWCEANSYSPWYDYNQFKTYFLPNGDLIWSGPVLGADYDPWVTNGTPHIIMTFDFKLNLQRVQEFLCPITQPLRGALGVGTRFISVHLIEFIWTSTWYEEDIQKYHYVFQWIDVRNGNEVKLFEKRGNVKDPKPPIEYTFGFITNTTARSIIYGYNKDYNIKEAAECIEMTMVEQSGDMVEIEYYDGTVLQNYSVNFGRIIREIPEDVRRDRKNFEAILMRPNGDILMKFIGYTNGFADNFYLLISNHNLQWYKSDPENMSVLGLSSHRINSHGDVVVSRVSTLTKQFIPLYVLPYDGSDAMVPEPVTINATYREKSYLTAIENFVTGEITGVFGISFINNVEPFRGVYLLDSKYDRKDLIQQLYFSPPHKVTDDILSITGATIVGKKSNGAYVIKYINSTSYRVVVTFPNTSLFKNVDTTLQFKGNNYQETIRLQYKNPSDIVREDYYIYTPDDLQNINDAYGTYHIMNDIDMAGYEWTNIYQNTDEPFYGALLGYGYTIKNLIMHTTDNYKNHGIISTAVNAIFDDIKLDNCKLIINGNGNHCGLLFGDLTYKVIDWSSPKLLLRHVQTSNIIVKNSEISFNDNAFSNAVGFVGGRILLEFSANEHTEKQILNVGDNLQAFDCNLTINNDAQTFNFGGILGMLRGW